MIRHQFDGVPRQKVAVMRLTRPRLHRLRPCRCPVRGRYRRSGGGWPPSARPPAGASSSPYAMQKSMSSGRSGGPPSSSSMAPLALSHLVPGAISQALEVLRQLRPRPQEVLLELEPVSRRGVERPELDLGAADQVGHGLKDPPPTTDGQRVEHRRRTPITVLGLLASRMARAART